MNHSDPVPPSFHDMRSSPNEPDAPAAPERLVSDLRRLAGRPAALPMFDARSVAARHFAARRAAKMRFALGGVGAAAAAGIALAVWLWPQSVVPASPGTMAAAMREDLNNDGRVDMLDAFVLARANADGTSKAEWDFSGDGRVDRADVDALALSAVGLAGGGGGGKL